MCGVLIPFCSGDVSISTLIVHCPLVKCKRSVTYTQWYKVPARTDILASYFVINKVY